MNPLATALADSLQRLLPATGAPEPLLLAAVGALSDALERGELALDLESDAPEAVPAEAWPQTLLQALEASGWLVAADALEQRPEAPIVHDGRWLRWRRWHLQLRQCLDQLLERAQGQPQPPVAAAALQAHLYLVALHRYLHWRLPGYDPTEHLGGYAYVFLRGVPGPMAHPEAGVPGVLVDTPALERLLALDALLREGQP